MYNNNNSMYNNNNSMYNNNNGCIPDCSFIG